MANEEDQNGLGGLEVPPVDIGTKPKKPRTRKSAGGGGDKKASASNGASVKKGAAKKTAAKAVKTKAQTKKSTSKTGEKKAAGPKKGTQRSGKPKVAGVATPKATSGRAAKHPAKSVKALKSEDEVMPSVLTPTGTEQETAVQAVGEAVSGETTGVVSAIAPPVSVLQGAQVRVSETRQVTVEPPPTTTARLAQVAQVAQVAQGTQPQRIIKVRNIDATLIDVTSHLIPNKVVVQGRVHLQIFFVLSDGIVHHLAEDTPFSTMLEIPGARPGMTVIVQPVIAAVLFHLNEAGTVLVKKVIIDVFAKAVEEVQINLLPGSGPTLLLQEVVGEGTTQVLNDNFVTLDVPAIKVDEIRGEIRDVTTEVIPDKVIIQGFVHKQIFFVDTNNVERHQAEDIHFSTFIDIPGARPGMNVQVHPRIETIIFELTAPTTLRQKVVVEIFVKVTTPIEFQAALGEGPLVRVAEVVGEGQGQILRRDVVTLDRPAVKIREITAALANLRSHVIPGKAILQGTIHKQIFFIGQDDIEYHQAEDVPFNIMVDIPGAACGLDLIAEPVIESVLFHLLSPTELEEKVIIQARLIVVDQRQVRLVLGTGPLVKVEQVVGENLTQVLVRLVNRFPPLPIQKLVIPITVVSTVQRRLEFRQQIIVENEVNLPVKAIKIAEVSAQVQNLRVTVIPSGLLVEGEIVKDIKFVGTDNMVRNITEVVPFSLIVNVPDVSRELVESVEVQIEQILFSISPDGRTVRQIIVIKAVATIEESTTEQFQLITQVEVPGLIVESVLVEEPVLTPGGVVLQQFPVITGLSGPGLSLVVSATFGPHVLNVVGVGEQTLNVLESIVVDP